MATTKEKSKAMNSCSEKNARALITDFMGEHLKRLDICTIGRKLFVSLYYEDFLPEREVRRYLEDHIDNLVIDDFERHFSTRANEQAVWLIEEQFPEIYVKEEDGCLRPTSLMLLIDEVLFHHSFVEPKAEADEDE